jgi:transcriptional regulator with XRE-family HTH domain
MNQHQAVRPWFWLRGDTGAGRALAGARHAAGLTQAELAARLGVDRTTVVNLEAGRNAAVSRLIRAFNGLGYDLIAVPRTARVTVDLRPQSGTALKADSPEDTFQ